MATMEERVARLEGTVSEHSQMFVMMRETLGSLERRFDRFEQRMDARFDAVDHRFDSVDRRFEAMESRFDKMSIQFTWVAGIIVTAVVAFAVAFIARR